MQKDQSQVEKWQQEVPQMLAHLTVYCRDCCADTHSGPFPSVVEARQLLKMLPGEEAAWLFLKVIPCFASSLCLVDVRGDHLVASAGVSPCQVQGKLDS